MYDELHRRAEEGRPVRIALIGAGKFGSMFLSQARRVRGLHLVGVADLSRPRIVTSLERVGWRADQYSARSAQEAIKTGGTYLAEDAETLISVPEIDVVIDATGHPASGIHHALLAIDHGHHIIMVNVEADALAGPLLARRATSAGVLLLAGLRRSTRAHRRIGRLGALQRIRCRLRRQGHEVHAGVSRIDPGNGVETLRIH